MADWKVGDETDPRVEWFYDNEERPREPDKKLMDFLFYDPTLRKNPYHPNVKTKAFQFFRDEMEKWFRDEGEGGFMEAGQVLLPEDELDYTRKNNKVDLAKAVRRKFIPGKWFGEREREEYFPDVTLVLYMKLESSKGGAKSIPCGDKGILDIFRKLVDDMLAKGKQGNQDEITQLMYRLKYTNPSGGELSVLMEFVAWVDPNRETMEFDGDDLDDDILKKERNIDDEEVKKIRLNAQKKRDQFPHDYPYLLPIKKGFPENPTTFTYKQQ